MVHRRSKDLRGRMGLEEVEEVEEEEVQWVAEAMQIQASFFFVFTPSSLSLNMAEASVESQVVEQLDQIYSPENLEKDSFFRELTEQNAEGCTCY